MAGRDAVSGRRRGKPFLELEPARQDEILETVEAGSAEGWPAGVDRSTVTTALMVLS